MSTVELKTESFDILPNGCLDRISVYFTDYALGRGMVTLVCFGNAWSAYFGGMGGNTIKEFVRGCDTEYLVNKLGYSQVLMHRKKDLAYLGKIIDAVKLELGAGGGRQGESQ